MLPVHVDTMVDDVRALKSEGIVVIIEVDGVVLLVEAHNHAIFQGRLIHHHIARLDTMIDGNPLNETHEELGLGLLVAEPQVLLGLDPQEHEREHQEPNTRVTPARAVS